MNPSPATPAAGPVATAASESVAPVPRPESWRTAPAFFWVLLAALVLNVFSGRWGEMGIPLGPDRLLFAGGLLLLLLDRRFSPTRRPRGTTALFVAMVAYSVWTLASIVWHAQFTTLALYAALDRVVLPLLLFAIAPAFLRTPFRRRVFLRALTLLGLYLVAITLAETAGALGFLFPRYIATYEVLPEAVASGEAARAGGPFLMGEANGMSLLLCGICAFLLARVDRGAWRALGLAVGALSLGASVLSLTRSVWLGGLLAVIVVVASRRSLWRWVPVMAALGVALALVGLAAAPDVATRITERGSTSRSLHDRANSNAAALRVVEETPVTGVGWGRFIDVAPEWVRQADTYPVTTVNIEIHNVFLSRAAELGIPAALLFVAILAFGPGAAMARRRDDPVTDDWRIACLAAGMAWIVPAMTSPVPYPFPTFVFFLLTGLVQSWPDPRKDPTCR
ncbi:O-antigen ligase family protein [Mobilicoccus pelagius]|uniref:O-antigen ligase-related domain-containing protein n=1 Tax=Mobilicoccus pelagius NBRC 104925 TaxID=1089455 RepID=H5UMR1_9MICO|nr:O-antigen ligase family protein [Mobilicoccus pelagius]GAB47019.1 hypothetical protein MOPEL_003_00420 [Mobilicoccus pelagius NBRC 104925]